MRRIALAGVLTVAMAGCGGQAKTVSVVGSDPDATAAPSSKRDPSPLPGAVLSRVEKSVLPVSCSSTNAETGFVGTGFRVRAGVTTASHVLAECPPGAIIGLGDGTGTVLTNDRIHDFALLTYRTPELPQNSRNPDPMPLHPASRPAYVGEPLALLGIPAHPLLGSPFTHQVTVAEGTVVATNHSQVLTLSDGSRETLTDAIEVACLGVTSGESGGPAVDRAGKVVGLIEGGTGSGLTTLTPVTDLTFPH